MPLYVYINILRLQAEKLWRLWGTGVGGNRSSGFGTLEEGSSTNIHVSGADMLVWLIHTPELNPAALRPEKGRSGSTDG